MSETWMIRFCPVCGGRASTPVLAAEGHEITFGCCHVPFMAGRRASVIREVAMAMYGQEQDSRMRESGEGS